MAKTVLEQLGSGALPDWHRVESAIRVKRLRTGDRLFRADDQHPYVYFVHQGIIKLVYETADGKEWIKAFAEEGRFFASLTALEPGGRTSFSACAACDAAVEQLPYQVLLALAETHPTWQKVLRRSFEIYGFRKETREKELLLLSAEERYRRFIEERGALSARLADKDIASYIRVTPVALSRIKKRQPSV
ncbi:Crp/Fnr family transcriptional regulator [Natronospirillum operosum]|uniref:Crp/Fnr family transcriptional regulator n=2 Tax=Natronospirillum operosum TaxID=2759953 RepID=A0A4Z0WDC6_9GAMM|nr:Crp/Fnr family transcriptional regulator [Natronospirillum operosum]